MMYYISGSKIDLFTDYSTYQVDFPQDCPLNARGDIIEEIVAILLRDNSEENRLKFYSTYGWQNLREEIKERDNFECQRCKKKGKVTVTNLEVHHIKELEKHPRLATDPSNLITVCKNCHNEIHDRFQENTKFREVW